MSALVPVFQSSYLYEIELAKTKLASRDIPSYIKNEYVNNIAVFPISQNYFLLAGATVSGVLMGMFQNNAGGAWDNAKKSFEKGVVNWDDYGNP